MRFEHVLNLLRHFGPSWLLYRTAYSQQIRRNVFCARLPIQTWSEQPLESCSRNKLLQNEDQYLKYRQVEAPEFFFAPEQIASSRSLVSIWDTGQHNPLTQCVDLEKGILRFFAHADVPGDFPPDWHRNYETGQSLRKDAHWSTIDDFNSGDIKLVWEPSRFSAAFSLVRAYSRGGDDNYAELFWQLVESWRAENPPQQGVNWKCGQEVAFRVLAWCFGLYGFLMSSATTSRRVAELVQMIAVSGHRIEANLRYALSQKNNHGISEATALWTIGEMFPEFSRANHWKQTGRHLLEKQAKELIYKDGAFSQHSVNYHRVMLHNYLWAMRLSELHGQPFSPELYQRIELAGQFLYQMQDRETGQLPNYGHNDGALVLPLNNCDYSDYRPIVQATQYLTKRTRCFTAGPWDEDLFWLFGNESLQGATEPELHTDLVAETSGYYTLRTPSSFIMTRVPRFRHRPSQADALHVDVWWQRHNIAIDAGTYSYNSLPPWNNVLGNTKYHNTVTVDDHDQMPRAGRFLWLPWLKANVTMRATSAGGSLQYLEARHNGYMRLDDPVGYRRAILRLGEEHWLVIDHLSGNQAHDYRLQWLLVDFPYEWSNAQQKLTLLTASGAYHLHWLASSKMATASVIRADPDSPRGWHSRYYHDRKPAVSLCLNAHEQSTCFYTLLGPEDCQLELQEKELRIASANWQVEVILSEQNIDGSPLVESVSAHGSVQERWELI